MGQATRALAGEFGRWRASGGVEPPLESAGSVIDGGGVAVPDCLGGGVADVERPDEVVRLQLAHGVSAARLTNGGASWRFCAQSVPGLFT